MDKKEFLSKLKRKLSILKKSEIDDIIDEYGGYIDEKVKKGKTEVEAIKDFGDFDELVKEILSAYKINEEYDEDSKVENVIANIFEDIVNTIDNLVKKLNKMKSGAIIKFIFEVLLVVICIAICHFPFSLIIDMGSGIFSVFMSPISNIFSGIWHFVIEMIYLVLAIIIFVKFFKERYTKMEDVGEESMETKNSEKEKTKTSVKSAKVVDEKVEEDKIVVEKKVVKEKVTNNDKSILITILSIIGKSFAILFTIPTVFALIGIIIAFVLSIILIGFGWGLFGIPLIIFSFLIAGSMFLEILIKIIGSYRINPIKIFVTLLMSIIFFGVGCGITAVSFANSTFTSAAPEKYEPIEKSIEIKASDYKKYYFDGSFTKYIVDETLGDKLKLSVKYYKEFIDIDLENTYNVYYNDYYWHDNYFSIGGKEIFNLIKEDIKNKKFYDYSLLFQPQVTIYGTKTNLDEITKNRYYDPSYEESDVVVGNNFTRTYSVLHLTSGEEENSQYITLKEINGPTYLVHVEGLKTKLKVNTAYDFTFKIKHSRIEDDVNSIFENSSIISVQENNGQDLFNEPICNFC